MDDPQKSLNTMENTAAISKLVESVGLVTTQSALDETNAEVAFRKQDEMESSDERTPEWFEEPLNGSPMMTGHAFFDQGLKANHGDIHEEFTDFGEGSSAFQRIKRRDQLHETLGTYSGTFDGASWQYPREDTDHTQLIRPDGGGHTMNVQSYGRAETRTPPLGINFGTSEMLVDVSSQGSMTELREHSHQSISPLTRRQTSPYIARRGAALHWAPPFNGNYFRAPSQDRFGMVTSSYSAPATVPHGLGPSFPSNVQNRGRSVSGPGMSFPSSGNNLFEDFQPSSGRTYSGGPYFESQMPEVYGQERMHRAPMPFIQSGHFIPRDVYPRQHFPVQPSQPVRVIPEVRASSGYGPQLAGPYYSAYSSPPVGFIAPYADYVQPQGDEYDYIVIPRRAIAHSQGFQHPLVLPRYTAEDFESGRVVLREPMLKTQQNQYGLRGPDSKNKKAELYKTELCRSWEETGTCRYGTKCQFAHSEAELRAVERHPKYKTELCKTFWESGTCPYGKRCCFIHTTKDLEKKEDDLAKARIILKKPEKKRLDEEGTESLQSASHHGLPIDDERTLNIIGRAGVEELRHHLRELRERERERERRRELLAAQSLQNESALVRERTGLSPFDTNNVELTGIHVETPMRQGFLNQSPRFNYADLNEQINRSPETPTSPAFGNGFSPVAPTMPSSMRRMEPSGSPSIPMMDRPRMLFDPMTLDDDDNPFEEMDRVLRSRLNFGDLAPQGPSSPASLSPMSLSKIDNDHNGTSAAIQHTLASHSLPQFDAAVRRTYSGNAIGVGRGKRKSESLQQPILPFGHTRCEGSLSLSEIFDMGAPLTAEHPKITETIKQEE